MLSDRRCWTHSWWSRCSGGRGALRVQVRLRSRGPLLHGLPGQPEAQPEGWPRQPPRPGGRHGAPHPLRRIHSICAGRWGTMRVGLNVSWRLRVLKQQLQGRTWPTYTSHTYPLYVSLSLPNCKTHTWIHRRTGTSARFDGSLPLLPETSRGTLNSSS